MSHSVVGKTHVVNRDDQVWVRISMLHWRGGACVCAVYIGSYHELENRRGACVRLFLRHSEHVVWCLLVLADLRHVLAIDNGPRWARSPGLAHLSLLGGDCRHSDVDWHHTVADGQRAQASLRGTLITFPPLRSLSPAIESRGHSICRFCVEGFTLLAPVASIPNARLSGTRMIPSQCNQTRVALS